LIEPSAGILETVPFFLHHSSDLIVGDAVTNVDDALRHGAVVRFGVLLNAFLFNLF